MASKVAAKDMDHVIGEMALLQARTEMYFKFFRKRAQVSKLFALILMVTKAILDSFSLLKIDLYRNCIQD